MPSRLVRGRKLSRAADVRDVASLCELERRCFPACDRFPPRIWRHLLGPARKRRTAITVISADRDEVAGAIVGLVRSTSAILRIYSIAVDPRARGAGLGARLIAELIARAPRRCATLVLEVRKNNPARKWYEHLGMRRVRVIPGYYADGAAGIRYSVDLSTLRANVRHHLKGR
jgi:[ribosomal protein S18]-alanine N-acetyltransferase